MYFVEIKIDRPLHPYHTVLVRAEHASQAVQFKVDDGCKVVAVRKAGE